MLLFPATNSGNLHPSSPTLAHASTLAHVSTLAHASTLALADTLGVYRAYIYVYIYIYLSIYIYIHTYLWKSYISYIFLIYSLYLPHTFHKSPKNKYHIIPYTNPYENPSLKGPGPIGSIYGIHSKKLLVLIISENYT